MICLKFLLLLASSIFFFDAALAKCNYSLNPIKVEWTGYKHNEKTPVSGTFKEIAITQPQKANTVDELIRKSSFVISAISADSGVELRDESLRNFFFKLLVDPQIKGSVESFKGDIAHVSISMNAVKKVIPFKIVQSAKEIVASSSIDILDFAMNKSLDSIHQKCFDLHKGKDGVSKTWSEVGLKVSATIVETCHQK